MYCLRFICKSQFKLVGRVVYVWNTITVNSPLTDTSLTHLELVPVFLYSVYVTLYKTANVSLRHLGVHL